MEPWKQHALRAALRVVLLAAIGFSVMHVTGVFYMHWARKRPEYLAAFETEELCANPDKVRAQNLVERCRQDEDWRQINGWQFFGQMVANTIDEESRHPFELWSLLQPPWYVVALLGYAAGSRPEVVAIWASAVTTVLVSTLMACGRRVADDCSHARAELDSKRLRQVELAFAQLAAAKGPVTAAPGGDGPFMSSNQVGVQVYDGSHNVWAGLCHGKRLSE